jgi:glycosyltransferase involved in cell wall biosynthesis
MSMDSMPTVSIVVPTYNRPALLKKAIQSILAQTFQDFEVIVVDDGLKERAQSVIESFNDSRIKYIAHLEERGGSAARNTGIKATQGEFTAFLDDDDEWLPEKLTIQMLEFKNTLEDVGFCFSGVENILKDKILMTHVPSGIDNYHIRALSYLKGFLTVTLIIKRKVFDVVGFFDEKFPSHQEADLMIRITEKFKGLGIDKPLVKVNMISSSNQVGQNIEKSIAGRELILEKYRSEFSKLPHAYGMHYFQLGLWHRQIKNYKKAADAFLIAFQKEKRPRYVLHYISMIGNGFMFQLVR